MEDDKRDAPEGDKEEEIIRKFIRLFGQEIEEYEEIEITFKKPGCDSVGYIMRK